MTTTASLSSSSEGVDESFAEVFVFGRRIRSNAPVFLLWFRLPEGSLVDQQVGQMGDFVAVKQGILGIDDEVPLPCCQ